MVFLLQPDFNLVAQLVLLNIDGQSPQNSDKKLASQVHLQALQINPISSLQCCKMASLAASLTFTPISMGPSPDSITLVLFLTASLEAKTIDCAYTKSRLACLLIPASSMEKSIPRMLMKYAV